METIDHRTVLIIARDGASHVVQVPLGALAARAYVTVHLTERSGSTETVKALNVYYAGAGVYYEKGAPCRIGQP